MREPEDFTDKEKLSSHRNPINKIDSDLKSDTDMDIQSTSNGRIDSELKPEHTSESESRSANVSKDGGEMVDTNTERILKEEVPMDGDNNKDSEGKPGLFEKTKSAGNTAAVNDNGLRDKNNTCSDVENNKDDNDNVKLDINVTKKESNVVNSVNSKCSDDESKPKAVRKVEMSADKCDGNAKKCVSSAQDRHSGEKNDTNNDNSEKECSIGTKDKGHENSGEPSGKTGKGEIIEGRVSGNGVETKGKTENTAVKPMDTEKAKKRKRVKTKEEEEIEAIVRCIEEASEEAEKNVDGSRGRKGGKSDDKRKNKKNDAKNDDGIEAPKTSKKKNKRKKNEDRNNGDAASGGSTSVIDEQICGIEENNADTEKESKRDGDKSAGTGSESAGQKRRESDASQNDNDETKARSHSPSKKRKTKKRVQFKDLPDTGADADVDMLSDDEASGREPNRCKNGKGKHSKKVTVTPKPTSDQNERTDGDGGERQSVELMPKPSEDGDGGQKKKRKRKKRNKCNDNDDNNNKDNTKNTKNSNSMGMNLNESTSKEDDLLAWERQLTTGLHEPYAKQQKQPLLATPSVIRSPEEDAMTTTFATASAGNDNHDCKQVTGLPSKLFSTLDNVVDKSNPNLQNMAEGIEASPKRQINNLENLYSTLSPQQNFLLALRSEKQKLEENQASSTNSGTNPDQPNVTQEQSSEREGNTESVIESGSEVNSGEETIYPEDIPITQTVHDWMIEESAKTRIGNDIALKNAPPDIQKIATDTIWENTAMFEPGVKEYFNNFTPNFERIYHLQKCNWGMPEDTDWAFIYLDTSSEEESEDDSRSSRSGEESSSGGWSAGEGQSSCCRGQVEKNSEGISTHIQQGIAKASYEGAKRRVHSYDKAAKQQYRSFPPPVYIPEVAALLNNKDGDECAPTQSKFILDALMNQKRNLLEANFYQSQPVMMDAVFPQNRMDGEGNVMENPSMPLQEPRPKSILEQLGDQLRMAKSEHQATPMTNSGGVQQNEAVACHPIYAISNPHYNPSLACDKTGSEEPMDTLDHFTSTQVPFEIITDAEEKIITNAEGKIITDAEGKIITDAEGKIITDAEGKIITDAEEKTITDDEENIIADAEVKIIADTEVKIIADAEEKIIADAEEKIIADAEEKIIADAEEKIIADAEEKIIADAEEKIITDAEEKIITDAEEKIITDAEEKIITDAEEKIITDAEEKIITDAEEKIITDAEEKIITDAEEKIITDAEEKIITDAEEKIITDAEEKIITDAEEKIITDAEEKIITDAEEKIATDAEEKIVTDAEEKIITDAEEKIVTDAEEKIVTDAEEKIVTDSEQNIVTDSEQNIVTDAEEKIITDAEEKIVTDAEEKIVTDAEEKIVTDAEEKIVTDAEEKIVTDAEEKIVTDAEEKIVTDAEEKIVTDAEEKIVTDAEEKIVTDAEEKIVTDAEEKIVTDAEEKIVTDAEEKIVTDAEEKIVTDAEEKIVTDAEEKIVTDAEQKIVTDAEQKIVTDAEQKIVTDAEQKIVTDAEQKIVTDAEQKIVTDAEQKIITDAEETKARTTKDDRIGDEQSTNANADTGMTIIDCEERPVLQSERLDKNDGKVTTKCNAERETHTTDAAANTNIETADICLGNESGKDSKASQNIVTTNGDSSPSIETSESSSENEKSTIFDSSTVEMTVTKSGDANSEINERDVTTSSEINKNKVNSDTDCKETALIENISNEERDEVTENVEFEISTPVTVTVQQTTKHIDNIPNGQDKTLPSDECSSDMIKGHVKAVVDNTIEVTEDDSLNSTLSADETKLMEAMMASEVKMNYVNGINGNEKPNGSGDADKVLEYESDSKYAQDTDKEDVKSNENGDLMSKESQRIEHGVEIVTDTVENKENIAVDENIRVGKEDLENGHNLDTMNNREKYTGHRLYCPKVVTNDKDVANCTCEVWKITEAKISESKDVHCNGRSDSLPQTIGEVLKGIDCFQKEHSVIAKEKLEKVCEDAFLDCDMNSEISVNSESNESRSDVICKNDDVIENASNGDVRKDNSCEEFNKTGNKLRCDADGTGGNNEDATKVISTDDVGSEKNETEMNIMKEEIDDSKLARETETGISAVHQEDKTSVVTTDCVHQEKNRTSDVNYFFNANDIKESAINVNEPDEESCKVTASGESKLKIDNSLEKKKLNSPGSTVETDTFESKANNTASEEVMNQQTDSKINSNNLQYVRINPEEAEEYIVKKYVEVITADAFRQIQPELSNAKDVEISSQKQILFDTGDSESTHQSELACKSSQDPTISQQDSVEAEVFKAKMKITAAKFTDNEEKTIKASTDKLSRDSKLSANKTNINSNQQEALPNNHQHPRRPKTFRMADLDKIGAACASLLTFEEVEEMREESRIKQQNLALLTDYRAEENAILRQQFIQRAMETMEDEVSWDDVNVTFKKRKNGADYVIKLSPEKDDSNTEKSEIESVTNCNNRTKKTKPKDQQPPAQSTTNTEEAMFKKPATLPPLSKKARKKMKAYQTPAPENETPEEREVRLNQKAEITHQFRRRLNELQDERKGYRNDRLDPFSGSRRHPLGAEQERQLAQEIEEQIWKRINELNAKAEENDEEIRHIQRVLGRCDFPRDEQGNVMPHCLKCGRKAGRKLSKCKRCLTALYCSRRCQLDNYPDHKERCRLLKRWNDVQEEISSVVQEAMSRCLMKLVRRFKMVPDTWMDGCSRAILVRVVNPFFFMDRVAAHIEDMAGDATMVVFLTPNYNYFLLQPRTDQPATEPGAPEPLPCKVTRVNMYRCLVTDMYMLLLGALWHRFPNNSVGLLMTNMSQIYFLDRFCRIKLKYMLSDEELVRRAQLQIADTAV